MSRPSFCLDSKRNDQPLLDSKLPREGEKHEAANLDFTGLFLADSGLSGRVRVPLCLVPVQLVQRVRQSAALPAWLWAERCYPLYGRGHFKREDAIHHAAEIP